jgi:hypothetical protein
MSQNYEEYCTSAKTCNTPLYIVGYGTLLYADSVGDTIGSAAKTKVYHPVIIYGFKRLFNLLPSHYKPSFKISKMPLEKAAANIIASGESKFNGLAFEVSEAELADIDKRERSYKRIETIMYDFKSGEPKGTAFVYSADEQKAILSDDPSYLPDWEDISWARTGAYRHGKEFGKMYDRTTFLADGSTLVCERYSDWLEELIINK